MTEANISAHHDTAAGADVSVLARARGLADEHLFPAALDVDASGEVPVTQLAKVADAGLYGLTSSDAEFGLAADATTVCAVIEALASGCLTTAFVWTQHLGAAAAASAAADTVRQRWEQSLASGTSRAGVAFAHLLRPGPPLTVAEPAGDGWRFTGSAPWVTGWGHIDVVHAAARYGDDIVWALLDASPRATLQADQLQLAAVNSSATVTLTYNADPVTADRVTRVEPYADWKYRYGFGLRTNGSLALGVASRCCVLLDHGDFTAELAAIRTELDSADIDAMPLARAAASAFAVRAAAALVATTGGRSVTMVEHGQRLLREAMFLLVQGQTPAIREHLVSLFSAPPSPYPR